MTSREPARLGRRAAYVFIQLPGALDPVPAARVEAVGPERDAPVELVYGERYLARPEAMALDPLELPLASRVYRTQSGFALFSALRDAAPDSWGRALIDKRAGAAGLTEFDYLLEAGDDRVGALDFGEDRHLPARARARAHRRDLAKLAKEVEAFVRGEAGGEGVRGLLEFGSSMGGARPKVSLEDHGALWVAKFNRRDDRINCARVEFATMRLARACGLEVAAVRLERLSGHDVLLVKRFDREPSPEPGLYFKRHFLSALTATGRTELESARSSYAEIAQHARRLCTQPRAQSAELFRRMVFNILCNNNDDHLRNHGFLHTDRGYVLSPGYDLVPQVQVGETRHLTLGVGARGKEASLANALTHAGQFGLDAEEARALVAKIQARAKRWRTSFKRDGVRVADLGVVERCFAAVNERLKP